MAKPSKRHHYLPQFYLRRFTGEDGFLSLFDRETKTFRKQMPLNTALEMDFHTVVNKQGVKTDRIEQILSELESGAKDVIQRLDERQTGWKNQEERAAFALFIALFYTRTPAFDKEQMAFTEHLYRAMNRANHPSLEVTAQGFKEYEQATGEDMSDINPEQVFQMIRDDKYEVEVPRTHIIRLMSDTALHLAEVLMTLNWTFVQAPRDLPFITSDAPFMIAPPLGESDRSAYGVLTPGAASTIPLSPSTCIVIEGEGGKDRYGHIQKDAARRINENVAMNSDRFIIARNQPYLERLVKRTRVGHYRWTSRFEFSTGEMAGNLLFHAKRTRPTAP